MMKHEKSFTRRLIVTAAAVLLVCVSYPTEAQFGFAIGPKGGLAVTSFEGDDAGDVDARTNWFGGIFTNFQLGDVVALQPELLLTERGAEITSNDVRSDISIKYFEVPVLLKLRWPLANEIVYPHVLLGPNFAFQTDIDFSSRDTQSGAVIEADADQISDTDFGAVLGAGVDVQTSGTGVFFTLDGRYGWGFSDLGDDDNMLRIRNAGWMFSLGVGFRIGEARDDFND